MPRNFLGAWDYLLVALILLPSSSSPRSLNANHARQKNETTMKKAKSFSSYKEIGNFVDGHCPPSKNIPDTNGIDGNCMHECSSDIDCAEDYKCCGSGCSFLCREPWFPNKVVDWAKESSLNQISDDFESPFRINAHWKSRGEPCSTSVLDGLQPLRCPTNYVCQISMDGDTQLNIPNRGECVKINDKQSITSIKDNENHPDFPTSNAECSHKGERYNHKEKFSKDCNICVCHNGVVFCDNRPCPVQSGIPGTASNFRQQIQSSHDQYISIDKEEEEDTDGVSGSGGSAVCDDDGHEDTQDKSLVDKELDEESSGDDNSEEGSAAIDDEEVSGEDISGDNYQIPIREVDNLEDGDNGLIDLKGRSKLNKQEFEGESGSTEMDFTEPTTVAETHRISTLELSPFKLKATTKPHEPTVDIIRLTGSDYEASVGLENYSGEEDEFSGSSDGDKSGSGYEERTEESSQSEPVYPDPIVLGKYVEAANQETEFGFETARPRIDVSNDALMKQDNEERSGYEGPTDPINDRPKYKQKNLEYVATTDDED